MKARDHGDRWTDAHVATQVGRTVLITGASSGVGLATAQALARRGATVLLGCRTLARGEAAAQAVLGEGGTVDVVPLDLASLDSVRNAAADVSARYGRLDALINNAGVMDVPHARTPDGFELTLASNHLGHFALTGLLLELLDVTNDARIVTVSSIAHRRGHIDFDDLHGRFGYDPSAAYAQSKLANVLFTYALARRLAVAGSSTSAMAAHPGNASTPLWRHTPLYERVIVSRRLRLLNFWAVQSPLMGSLPTLRAACDPDARNGDFYGPDGRGSCTGYPVKQRSSAASHDVAVQERLWEVSERITGVTYPTVARVRNGDSHAPNRRGARCGV